MQQTQKKTIVVIGASGHQGGAVVQALLNEYKDKVNIRGVVRNVNSEAAIKMQKQGIEVVAGDLLDKDSLVKAFQGANSAFLVPIYDFQNINFQDETKQIKNMADAAKEAKLEHVIYSTLDLAELKAKGKLPEIEGMTVPFYDNKGRMDQYFRDLQIPTTFVLTCYYASNIIYKLGMVKVGDKYMLNWNLADKILCITILEDLGRIAASILVNKSHIGEYIGGVSDFLTIKQMAEILSKALNAQFVYNELTDEQYRKLPFPIAPLLCNMFAYQRMFNEEYVATRKTGSKVIKDLKTYEQWVNENIEALKTIL